MRPNSFPTLRIAQLASLIYNNNRLFSKFINFENKKQLDEIFDFNTS